MANSVTTTFFANEKDAAAAIVRLEKKYDDLENKVKHFAKSANKAHGEAVELIPKWAEELLAPAASYLAIGKILDSIIEKQKESLEVAEKVAAAEGSQVKNLRIKLGLSAADSNEAKEHFRRLAVATGFPGGAEGVGGVANDLAAAGFGKEAVGPALEEFVRGQPAISRASGTLEVTPHELAQAVKKSLDKQGKAPTAANVREELRDTFALLRGTDLDLEEVNKIRLALMTAGGSKDKKHALAKMKLKPADVDLIGETQGEAFERLAAGLKNVKETQREPLLAEIFGVKKLDTIKRILGNVPQLATNRAAFEEAMTIAGSGHGIEKQKFAAEEEIQKREGLGRVPGSRPIDEIRERDLQIRAEEVARRGGGIPDVINEPLSSLDRFFNDRGTSMSVTGLMDRWAKIMNAPGGPVVGAGTMVAGELGSRATSAISESLPVRGLMALAGEIADLLREIRDGIAKPRPRRDGGGGPP